MPQPPEIWGLMPTEELRDKIAQLNAKCATCVVDAAQLAKFARDGQDLHLIIDGLKEAIEIKKELTRQLAERRK